MLHPLLSRLKMKAKTGGKGGEACDHGPSPRKLEAKQCEMKEKKTTAVKNIQHVVTKIYNSTPIYL